MIKPDANFEKEIKSIFNRIEVNDTVLISDNKLFIKGDIINNDQEIKKLLVVDCDHLNNYLKFESDINKAIIKDDDIDETITVDSVGSFLSLFI